MGWRGPSPHASPVTVAGVGQHCAKSLVQFPLPRCGAVTGGGGCAVTGIRRNEMLKPHTCGTGDRHLLIIERWFMHKWDLWSTDPLTFVGVLLFALH
jgi:hypothetical protein